MSKVIELEYHSYSRTKDNRVYFVVSNSRDFSSTCDVYSDVINKLIKPDLKVDND